MGLASLGSGPLVFGAGTDDINSKECKDLAHKKCNAECHKRGCTGFEECLVRYDFIRHECTGIPNGCTGCPGADPPDDPGDEPLPPLRPRDPRPWCPGDIPPWADRSWCKNPPA